MDSLNSLNSSNGLHLPNNHFRNDPQVEFVRSFLYSLLLLFFIIVIDFILDFNNHKEQQFKIDDDHRPLLIFRHFFHSILLKSIYRK